MFVKLRESLMNPPPRTDVGQIAPKKWNIAAWATVVGCWLTIGTESLTANFWKIKILRDHEPNRMPFPPSPG